MSAGASGTGGEGSYTSKGRGGEEREKRGGDGRGKEEKGGGRRRGKGGRGLRRGPLRILAGGPECEVTPLGVAYISAHCRSPWQLRKFGMRRQLIDVVTCAIFCSQLVQGLPSSDAAKIDMSH